MRRFRVETVPLLDRDPVHFSAEQRRIVGESFTQVVERLQLVVHACAVMSNHVHILIRRGKHTIEYLVNQLKGAATHDLEMTETPWTRGTGWKVFLDDEDALPHVVRYIEANPRQARLPEQDWDFLFPLERYYRSLEKADAEAARRRADDR
jgi:REP element-mobilizing transposase RayT